MAFESAGTIISDVAVEVGLSDPGETAVYASADGNVVQMRRLLKSVGRDLVRAHPWSHLQREHTFSTVADTATYELPSDYGRVTGGTEWNRTEQEPLSGPMTPQGWQVLKSSIMGNTLEYFFRVRGRSVELHPTPASVDEIALEYLSEWWTCDDATETPTKEAPTAYTDVVLLDSHLVTRALKLAFLEAKGFDTTAALSAYERAWVMATGGDGGAPVLSISGGLSGIRLVGASNAPETGYGGG